MNLIRKLFPRSLYEAVEAGNVSSVRRYISSMPSREEKDKAFLAAIQGQHLEIAQILVDQGADINTRDPDGDSALHYACSWPTLQYRVVKWLVENGADVNASDYCGMTPETGNTPLSDVSSQYDFRTASYLLSAGANPNALTPSGTALYRACQNGIRYKDQVFQQYGGNIILLLLEHGADPNLQDQFESKTPLHAATDFWYPGEYVRDRYLAIVKLLLRHGATPSIKDKEGWTALDYAQKNGYTRIVKVLQQSLLCRSTRPPLSMKELAEKAQEAPSLIRILVDVTQKRLEQDYPQVLLLPEWPTFQMVASVAGCFSLALRLHYEVLEEYRTATELKMRECLQCRFPESEQLYEDCSQFLTRSLSDASHSKRSKYIFPLIAKWVISHITDGEELENQEHIVGQLAYVYLNESAKYWNSSCQ